MTPISWREGFPGNVWVGVSVENQEQADKRIPELLKIPAKVRFVSVEPMLEEINLYRWIRSSQCTNHNGYDPFYTRASNGKWRCPDCGDSSEFYQDGGIDWVICGAESGSNRRPFKVEWAENLYRQCHDANVPFFMKQDSAYKPGQQGRIPDWLWNIKEFPNV